MVRYLSREWVDALDVALSSAGAPGVEVPLVIQQRVHADPPVEWHLVVGADGAAARWGRAEHPTVELSQDLATALAVAQGHTSSEEALLTGRIVVRGDVGAAAANREVFARLGDALAELRTRTDFTTPAASGPDEA